jgi:hypothetical protein
MLLYDKSNNCRDGKRLLVRLLKLAILLDDRFKYCRDLKELFMKSEMFLDEIFNYFSDGKKLYVNTLMFSEWKSYILLKDDKVLFEKFLKDLSKCRETTLSRMLLSNASRFFESDISSVLRSGAVLFLMYCTFSVLKFTNLRELNTFDSNTDTGYLLKSRYIRLCKLLPIKLLTDMFLPILMPRNCSSGKMLSLKSLKF